jgi:transcription antitermination factor NusG
LKPLFTSYVFVRATPQQLVYVKDVPGVVNLLHWLGKPAIVRDQEITCIKDFLNDHPAVDLEKMNVNINDNVRIVRGAFMDKEGIVVQVSGNSVKIEIPSMGYALVASINKTNIALIKKDMSVNTGFDAKGQMAG